MSSLCALLGYSRQAIHKYKKNAIVNDFEAELIIQQVLKHRKLQPRLGTRKLLVLLKEFIKSHSLKVGRDGLFTLLREHELLIRKRRRKVQTTFSKHWLKKYPNLTSGLVINRPNALWVSDITYIETANEYSYLSLVTDAYSRRIMGFALSKTLEATGCIGALKMALQNRAGAQDLIHHSDRGVQYCCKDYVNMLAANQIKISMTENGDPLENAVAERINGILKDELLRDGYPCFEVAQKEVAKAISIYNSLRPHSSCDMLTPDIAHQKQGYLKRHWKNYITKRELLQQKPVRKDM